MDKVLSDFEKLLGQQATSEQRERLLNVKNQLDLNDSDGLWPVLFALEHYTKLYEQIPGQVSVTAEKVLDGVKTSAESIIQAQTASVQTKLADAVVETSKAMTEQAIKADKLKTFSAVAVAVALLSCVAFAVGKHSADTVPAIVSTTAGKAGLELAKQNPNLQALIDRCEVKAVNGRKACAVPVYLDGAPDFENNHWLIDWFMNIKAVTVLLLAGLGFGGWKGWEFFKGK